MIENGKNCKDNTIRQRGQRVRVRTDNCREISLLTRFAVATRYPDFTMLTRRKCGRTVRIAAVVLRWAERQIAPRGKKHGNP
jgi:hypothetical protein